MLAPSMSESSKIDESKLTPIGLGRLKNGVRCFVYPERNQKVGAVCIDWGLHASGATVAEAKSNLHEVIHGMISVASENGNLYEFLNAPINRAALRTYRNYRRIDRAVSLLSLPFRGFSEVARMIGSIAFDSYTDSPELTQRFA